MKIANRYLIHTVIFLSFSACSVNSDKPDVDQPPADKLTENISAEIIMPDNSLKGDFDGDAKPDSVELFLLDTHNGKKVSGFPKDIGLDEDAIQDYLADNKIELVLRLRDSEPLKLGQATGILALINLGDVNNDKKEDIAVVVDYPDQSAVNTCAIYSYCDSKWVELKQINIHESAFISDSLTNDQFTEIPGYLEKKNGTWLYRDYLDQLENEQFPFKKLELIKCSEASPKS